MTAIESLSKKYMILYCRRCDIVYVAENGILIKAKLECDDFFIGDAFKEIVENSGYSQKYIESYSRWHDLMDFIDSFVGKDISDLKNAIDKRVKINQKNRIAMEKSKEALQESISRFGNVLISVKEINYFETGVNIFVLLSSSISFREQSTYIKENKEMCLDFILFELKRKNKNKATNLIRFCQISQIVVTRENEVLFTFELKEKIQDILENKKA